jgi:transposase
VRAVVLPSRESARFTVLLLHIFARAKRRAADNPGMTQRRDKNDMPPSRCASIGNFPRPAGSPRRRCRGIIFWPVVRGGSNSVGRVSASQAEGRGFESRLPLQIFNKYFRPGTILCLLSRTGCKNSQRDYKRNGTTTLFAALNVLDGKVIGECHGRHRHQEWLKFLRRLDAKFPPQLKLHLVMDNYGTHKEPHVQAWLKKHPRFVCHFVPTSSSWLNLVERWFRELTEKAIRRGSFVSVPDLKQAIEAFMQAWNQHPKRFIWSATVEDIIKKIDRARVKMEQIKPGSTQPRGKRRQLICKDIYGTLD